MLSGLQKVIGILLATSVMWLIIFPAAAEEKIEYTRYVKYPVLNYNKLASADTVKRGEYLVKVGDCAACHTSLDKGAKTFAGGLGIKTPFGTFYTPNITADKATGIGKWSDDDFVNTMHKGVAPGWRHLYPVFPYVYYARIKREDLLAIKAYLFSVPSVHAPKKENDVGFPFNLRFLQIGWRLLFFHFQNPGVYKDNPAQSAEWNRGAYLVQGLGHCGMCHTPLNPLGAAKNKYFLRGGFVDGYYAADITGDALKESSIEEIVNVFAKGQHLGGSGEIHGPMEEVDHNSLRYLQRADMRAIAVYLKSVHSAKLASSTVSASGDDAAEQLYESKCAICHDTGAAGAPKLGDKAAWAPRIKLGVDVLHRNAIRGLNSMPPKGTCMSCSDAQIEAVVDYMVEQAEHSEGAVVKGQPPRKTTIERGKKVYQQHCASCHDSGNAPRIGDKRVWQPLLAQGMPALMRHTLHAPHVKCTSCSDGDVIAAIKYMAQQSKQTGDYRLW